MRRNQALPVLAALPLALGLAAAPAEAATTAVSMSFESTTADGDSSSTVDLTNSGSGSTSQQVITSGGGFVRSGASATGEYGALRLPAYTDGSETAPRAVVAITNTGSADILTPGSSDFSYGADVFLGATNDGGPADNGNNVLQRGLYGSRAQYKLQVDHGAASCRVKGSAGDLVIAVPVSTRAWYRLSCTVTRGTTEDVLTISAAPISSSGALEEPVRESTSGLVGELSYAITTPMSVGGKLKNDLTLHASSDQYNGRVDNVMLSIG